VSEQGAPETGADAVGGPAVVTDAVADPAGSGEPSARRPFLAGRDLRRPTWLGLLGGAVGFFLALTPSLLPRPWLFEGVIAGLGAALGYGVGVLLSWLLRRLGVPEPSPAWKHRAWIAVAVLVPLVAVGSLLQGTAWQNEVRTLVSMPDEGLITAVQVGVLAVGVAWAAVAVGRLLRRFNAWIARHLAKVLPGWLALGVSVAVIVLVVLLAINDVLLAGFVSVMNNIYAGTNASTKPGVVQPTSPERSGSPGSLVSWDSLGMEGRNFVARGPSPQDLSHFSGKPAPTPVRVYVGLDSAATAADRAALAVKELERTGAFSRKVLVVGGTTGTGWLEPQSVDTVEYEWNGDSAIVGIQYSFLPSWIATIVDVDKASDAGRAVFDAVYAKWRALPAGSRPLLLGYGLSLGSFSLQSAFPDAADISARAQGAVFVGSPNFSQPWGQIEGGRDAGSPEWQPVYGGGRTIRFAGVPSDLARPSGAWTHPRVAYVQHASDPVVWWTPSLLFKQPDWLREPPGPDRTPAMRYIPVITFLQVTVDQFVGVAVPAGHGHNYGSAMPATFAAVAPPPGWTEADTTRLSSIIDTMAIE
jgi:uncharacterized membrane protein